MVFTAPGCIQRFGAQEGLGPGYYRTVTDSPNDFIVLMRMGDGGEHNKALMYTTEGFICGTHHKTKGTYTGNVTVKGKNALGAPTRSR
jgi:hypothetical protein